MIRRRFSNHSSREQPSPESLLLVLAGLIAAFVLVRSHRTVLAVRLEVTQIELQWCIVPNTFGFRLCRQGHAFHGCQWIRYAQAPRRLYACLLGNVFISLLQVRRSAIRIMCVRSKKMYPVAVVRRQLLFPFVLPHSEMLPKNFPCFCPESRVDRDENLSSARTILQDTGSGW